MAKVHLAIVLHVGRVVAKNNVRTPAAILTGGEGARRPRGKGRCTCHRRATLCAGKGADKAVQRIRKTEAPGGAAAKLNNGPDSARVPAADDLFRAGKLREPVAVDKPASELEWARITTDGKRKRAGATGE